LVLWNETSSPGKEANIMRIAIVIPARYHSTRLPGKLLLRETGKYLIQHVYERARLARLPQRVLVAADDSRIEAAVRSFGGEVVLTRRDHTCGTDRIAEVAAKLDEEIVINLQGDEPLINPDTLDHLGELMRRSSAEMATLAVPITSDEEYRDPNVVKVVLGDQGQALYFSRSPIPYQRDGSPDFRRDRLQFLRHVGLYAYRRPFLLQLAKTPTCALENLEKLEQLRVLNMGKEIQVGVINAPGIGVDTWDDYRKFVSMYRQQRTLRTAA
jgi:3-deoxy-manno-octulosonate cytidylyltransferase (CMP-KDO synthetase)